MFHTVPDGAAQESQSSFRPDPVDIDAPQGGEGDKRPEGASAGTAPLVSNKSCTSPPPPSYAQYELRDALREITNLSGLKGCGARGIPQKDGGVKPVEVWRDHEGGKAHLRNVISCGSISVCPVCQSKIRMQRAEEIRTASERAMAAGHALYMVTVTMSHKRGDRLETELKVLRGVVKRLNNGKAAQTQRKRHKIFGYIRATEVTVSDPANRLGNGWHAHAHSLIAVDPSTDMAELKKDWLRVLREEAAAQGLPEPSEKHGVHVVPVQGLEAVSRYVAKACPESWGAASELARLDSKKGRWGNWTPMQLAKAAAIDGCADSIALWREFEHAMKGFRSITFSKSMRDLVNQESDEEVAAADEDASELVETISTGVMSMIAEAHHTAVLLRLAASHGKPGVHQAIWLAQQALRARRRGRSCGSGAQGRAAA